MDKDQFHKAARDGFLDLLRETTRKDCNEPDEDGFSPTIWSCYNGRLDACRLLVGRGGDPDKSDLLGNTSLHWAAANGHFDCVTFLVNFGCNIWSLNNDFQTAKDFAALRNHKVILDFLDNTMAQQSALNPKLVQRSKERAVVEAERRIKQFEKIQRKATKKAEKEETKNAARRRKLLEPIQITSNHRLQPVEYSTISNSGTLRWTVASKKSKDAPLKFSDLVNNTNTMQRTNQFNSLLSNVKGTLNGSTSLSLVRSLGAVSKKVQLKKQSSTSSSSSTDEQQATNDEREQNKRNQDQCMNGQLNENNLSAIKSQTTVRSLTGLCRDTDVLYVRKQPNYGLNPSNQNLLHLNNVKSTEPRKTNNNLNKEKSSVFKCEGERSIKSIEEKRVTNSSVKSLDNNNNTKQSVTLSKTRLKLKELFVQMKVDDTAADTLYKRNGKTTKSNSISKVSTLFKRGLTRATSEPDIVFELKKSESKSSCRPNDEYRSNYLNRTNRSQLIQSTAKLNNLNHSNKLNSLNNLNNLNKLNSLNNVNDSLNGSIFRRPGFGSFSIGSMAFRNNLFAQVLQLSKQLNELDGGGETSSFRPFDSANNRLTLQKQQTQPTDRLQLMQRMNKQLRNEQENDSIGNSLSSRSTNSSNSSTNSTLSSNLIETELTDNLDMKLSSKSLSKTRKSLKSIQCTSANPNDANHVDQLATAQVDSMLDKHLDNQANDQQIDEPTSQIDKQSNAGTDQQSNDSQKTNVNQQTANNQQVELPEQLSVEQAKENQLEVKLDQQVNDKLESSEQCQRKQANLTKKYHETYEKLNGQMLNRKETTNRTASDKLYEKKNDKLLKIKDKFLNRLNSRLEFAKDRHPMYEAMKAVNCSETTKELSINDSSKSSSNCSSRTNSLSKQMANQLDDLESWQDAGTEIAIEKISTICTSNPSPSHHEESNLIENRIKKFENINRMNNLSAAASNDDDVKLHLNNISLLKEDSHVFKLMVKNRDSNEPPIHYL